MKITPYAFAAVLLGLTLTGSSSASAALYEKEKSLFASSAQSVESSEDALTQKIRNLQTQQTLLLAQAAEEMDQTKRAVSANALDLEAKSLLQKSAKLDGGYILKAQFDQSGHPADGAINNVFGDPTWIVPRENALAILGLLESAKILGSTADAAGGFTQSAQAAADYLVRVQDLTDGGWFDQYSYENPVTQSKSPTQTAEVMMALFELGYRSNRYQAMKKGAQFLMSLQDPANKGGINDGLIGGGKAEDGSYHTWRWTSDNSFAYWALKAAAKWAVTKGDGSFATKANAAADLILKGINKYLYISDTTSPDYGVWKRVMDKDHNVIDPGFHEWINYAPQMLDLPAKGVGSKIVGEWIHKTFQKSDGSVVWNDGAQSNRKSPGFSFQAMLVWKDLGQTAYYKSAKNWAVNSGLWQTTPDGNGVTGGWVDWTENGNPAPSWQRFIDTSFYAVTALGSGYDFRI